MTTPVPKLRRDEHAHTANGRKVVIVVFIFFVLLVAFVLTLVFTIGLHNNGVKPPPLEPTSSSAPGSSG